MDRKASCGFTELFNRILLNWFQWIKKHSIGSTALNGDPITMLAVTPITVTYVPYLSCVPTGFFNASLSQLLHS